MNSLPAGPSADPSVPPPTSATVDQSQLDPQELNNLASFFARRFPQRELRAQLSDAAGLRYVEAPGTDPRAAWDAMLEQARQDRLLSRLAYVLAAERPSDDNLQEVAAILGARPPRAKGPPQSMWKQNALVGAALLSLAITGFWTLEKRRSPAEPEALPQLVDVVAPAEAAPPKPWTANNPLDNPPAPVTVGAEASASALRVAPVEAPASAPSPAPAAATPAPSPAAQAAKVEAPPAKVEAPAPRAPEAALLAKAASTAPSAAKSGEVVQTRCGAGAPGELLGYWYAGQVNPGVAGQTYTLKGSANVRRQMPSAANDWKVDGEIRCTLRPGQSVRLSRPPVQVEGGKYWVPLLVGDLG